jgi:hypothetical protein
MTEVLHAAHEPGAPNMDRLQQETFTVRITRYIDDDERRIDPELVFLAVQDSVGPKGRLAGYEITEITAERGGQTKRWMDPASAQ